MSNIVTMTGCHVPQVAALEKECFSDPWSQRSVASELENPLALWLVWEEDGQVLGYVGSQTVLDETDMNILGTSLDDAAGECFDKVARVLGMPYPGGAALDRASQQGDETKYSLPRSKPGENPYNMSFSGLKTAALNLIHHAQQVGEEIDVPSLCASFSAAVSDTLVPRMVMAMEQTGYRKVAVAGGVAANSRIRRDILAAAQQLGAQGYMPPLSLCGDNGAMIGAQAYYEYLAGNTADMSLNAYATKSILGEAL